jgi:aspartyl aminopeptidase
MRRVSDPVLSDLLAFLGDSPTPFHAVASATARLTSSRFQLLAENDSWADLAPGRYVFPHGGSSLLAFVIPDGKKVSGFRIVGAHTDSPNLRLKPNPEYEKEGYAQLGVEVYGGALVNSWLDRDLSIAGRVFVRGEGTRLVRFKKPMARVAHLAIHLDREVVDKGLVLN